MRIVWRHDDRAIAIVDRFHADEAAPFALIQIADGVSGLFSRIPYHGLRRTLLANCIEGVTKGFSKSLEVIGVGYRVAVKGNLVELSVGFSHPVLVELPEGIQAKAEGQILTISGADKELVGEMAAKIRRIRKPEPYKGKGIKYTTETIRRKVGKSGGKK